MCVDGTILLNQLLYFVIASEFDEALTSDTKAT